MDDLDIRGTSGTITDSSGNGLNGTTNVNVSMTPSMIVNDSDSSMLFFGVSFASIPFDARIHPGDLFSLEWWMIFFSMAGPRNVIKNGVNDFQVICNPSGILFGEKQGDGIIWNTSAIYADGRPHHFVWTKNAGTSHVYADGVDLGLVITDQTIASSGTATIIGDNAQGVNISLDECAIYNYVLTPTQVLNHFITGHGARILI